MLVIGEYATDAIITSAGRRGNEKDYKYIAYGLGLLLAMGNTRTDFIWLNTKQAS